MKPAQDDMKPGRLEWIGWAVVIPLTLLLSSVWPWGFAPH